MSTKIKYIITAHNSLKFHLLIVIFCFSVNLFGSNKTTPKTSNLFTEYLLNTSNMSIETITVIIISILVIIAIITYNILRFKTAQKIILSLKKDNLIYNKLPIIHVKLKLHFDSSKFHHAEIISANNNFNTIFKKATNNILNNKNIALLFNTKNEYVQYVKNNKPESINIFIEEANKHYNTVIYPTNIENEVDCFLTDFSDIVTAQKFKKEAQQKFFSIYDNIPIPIVILDKNYISIECNKMFTETMGIDKTEYISANHSLSNNPIFTAEDIEDIKNGVFAPREISYNLEYLNKIGYFKTKNHSKLNFLCMVDPVSLFSDGEKYYIFILIDISKINSLTKNLTIAKKITDDLLAKQEIVLSNINDSFIYINKNFEIEWESIKYIEGQPKYTPGTICYESSRNRTTPCEGCVLAKILETGNKETSILKYGQITQEVIATPILDENNEILGGVIKITDVTEREENQRITKENLLLLSMSTTLGNLVPWVWDIEEDTVSFLNTTSTDTEREKEKVKFSKKYLYDSTHPDDKQKLINSLDHFLTKGDLTFDCELRIRVITDDYVWYHFQCMVFEKDQFGENTKVLGFLQDISKSKTQEETLKISIEKAEESNRLKLAFLANMSHEIRTPLNAIVGFSEIIADMEDGEDKQEFISIIKNNSTLLLQLISDILDLSKIESATLDFTSETFDINKLFNEVEQHANLSCKKDIKIRFKDHALICIIKSDRNRLTQVLNNFVSNAIKFTENGTIDLGYKIIEDEQKIYFYVKDCGCGIAPEKHNDVFNRFVKLNSFVQGTGLGLSICKSIIERLNGEIGVSSHLGVGSTFWFTLPMSIIVNNNSKPEILEPKSNDVILLSEEISTKTEDNKTPEKYDLLIAEDNTSNYTLYKSILSKSYNLIHAWNGEEAVTLFKKHKPKVVLMDIKMPVLDGYGATKQIRELTHSNNTKIIAVTAFAYANDEEKIMSSGFNDYITKPINSKLMKEKIEYYLNSI